MNALGRRASGLRTGLTGLVGLVSVGGVAACGTGNAKPVALGRVSAPLEVSARVIGTDAAVPLQSYTSSYMGLANGGEDNLLVIDQGGRIRGLRHDATTGTVLDLEDRIAISSPERSASYPNVAYGGGVYVAVYDDFSDTDGGVYALAIDRDGSPVGQPSRVVADGLYGTVIYNGTDFTVAALNASIGLTLTRVGVDGNVVPDSEAFVTEPGAVANRPALAMSNDVGLVVFEQEVDGASRKVFAARFEPSGEVLDPGGIQISDATTSSVDVSAATGDAGFLAVWSGYPTAAEPAVFGSFVSFDGEIMNRESPISRSPARAGGSAVAYDGEQYLIVWHDERDETAAIYGTRLAPSGTQIDAQDVKLGPDSRANQSYNLGLVWGNGRFTLAYHTDAGIAGRFLDSDLNELDPGALELSPVPNQQILPMAVWTGSEYVLVWSDERIDMQDQFRSVRIDGAGTVLDREGIGLSPAGERVGGIGVAFNGQTVLYTWIVWDSSGAEVSYKRTQGADGSLSEPEPWLTGEGSGPAVSNGDTFMSLAYAGDNGNGNENEVWGHRFDANGDSVGDAFLIQTISRPRAFLWGFGDEYLVAYSGQEIDGAPITGSALSISSNGEITAEYGPVREGILTASGGSNGEQLLVSWQDATTGALWGRLLSKVDGWGEPFVLTEQIAEGPPAISWDGASFVVVWGEDRTAMWSRNVSQDGGMSEPERLFAGDYGWPTLTPGAEGQMLLSYVDWTEVGRRIRSRIVGVLGEGVDQLPPDSEVGGEVDPTEPGQGAGGATSNAEEETSPDDGTTPEDGAVAGESSGSGGGANDVSPDDTSADSASGGSGSSPEGSATQNQGGAGSSVDASGETAPTAIAEGSESTSGNGSSGSEPAAANDASGSDSSGSEAAPASDGPGNADSGSDPSAEGADAANDSGGGSAKDDGGGCSVSTTRAGHGLGWLGILLAGVVWQRRRKGGQRPRSTPATR